jgi:copper resistance protein B
MSGMNTLQRMHVSLVSMAITLALAPAVSLAQEMDHSGMHMPMPEPKAAPARKPTRKKVATKPQTKPSANSPHTGHDAQPAPMDHSAMKHDMPMPMQTPVDHAAMGHDMGTMEEDHPNADHAGMSHEGMSNAPTEARTPIPVLTDADRAAAAPPPQDHPVHDNSIQSFVLFDRLETWNADPGTGIEWEGEGWIGTDRNKLWLRSEGERRDGVVVGTDLEVLYGRSIAPWWDVVAGVRHDFKPGPSQDFAAVGVMGLTPYKFEVAATGYIGQSGQTAARLEAEYEALLSNRLILQPLIEANFYGQNDERRAIGSGLGTLEAGVRLRYEVTRRFAPYIGVVQERAFGRTADFRRADGEDVNDTRIVAGLRIWF